MQNIWDCFHPNIFSATYININTRPRSEEKKDFSAILLIVFGSAGAICLVVILANIIYRWNQRKKQTWNFIRKIPAELVSLLKMQYFLICQHVTASGATDGGWGVRAAPPGRLM